MELPFYTDGSSIVEVSRSKLPRGNEMKLSGSLVAIAKSIKSLVSETLSLQEAGQLSSEALEHLLDIFEFMEP